MLDKHGGQGIFIRSQIPYLFALLYAGDVSSVADSALQMQMKINVLEYFDGAGYQKSYEILYKEKKN